MHDACMIYNSKSVQLLVVYSLGMAVFFPMSANSPHNLCNFFSVVQHFGMHFLVAVDKYIFCYDVKDEIKYILIIKSISLSFLSQSSCLDFAFGLHRLYLDTWLSMQTCCLCQCYVNSILFYYN